MPEQSAVEGVEYRGIAQTYHITALPCDQNPCEIRNIAIPINRLRGAGGRVPAHPWAISASIVTVFQLRVVALTPSAFSIAAFDNFVSP